MAKKRRLFLLGEGYPWYHYTKSCFACQGKGYYEISLASGPNHELGRKLVEFKLKWGAYKKVRIWIEDVAAKGR